MDLEYFKTQIEEELQGEADYRAKAEECPKHAKVFEHMAEQEHEHANNLLAMLKDYADESAEIYKQLYERM